MENFISMQKNNNFQDLTLTDIDENSAPTSAITSRRNTNANDNDNNK